MKEKRLLNELGNVNDEFIEQAKPKIKRNRKKERSQAYRAVPFYNVYTGFVIG